ncbi:ATP-dependent DNA helicase [Planktothrix mougeotii LEGE 06226]|uniref:ATP-dependent DNA helicase n=2 Tax=Planktothrix mougeotii TaxID=54306 RepID=A0ABR9ULS4_9CYAN|nr:ATP-dependent DNA helicase [Planktothrix mougeotii LEGE 06226]
MIEVEVHNLLRNFLKSQTEVPWPHHLTMARLVARALRLGRNALIQTGIPPNYEHHSYRFSYWIPLLVWRQPTIVVASDRILDELQRLDLPAWINSQPLNHPDLISNKPIVRGDSWPYEGFPGVLLTPPQAWLSDRLKHKNSFPQQVVTVIDGVDDLEAWTRQTLTVSLHPQDWNHLMQQQPQQAETIRDARVHLTRVLFQHPPNPYQCYVLDSPEQEIIEELYAVLNRSFDPVLLQWQQFWQRWKLPEQLKWAVVDRTLGTFSLFCGPIDVASELRVLWPQQPVVLIGGALDLDKTVPVYRQSVGLGEITSVKFTPDRQSQLIQLYIPSGLPLPNTPQYQQALIKEIYTILCMSLSVPGLSVLLIGDVPLKAQVSTAMAAEFGSRVQVETTNLSENGVLVTGWEFWRQHQGRLPSPHLLAIATLPIPSLEDPLVAGQVAYYKQRHLDWFRFYLLPTALSELQRAVATVRDSQGVVALFDSRVLHRSYGEQVLTALSPSARINYLDTLWLGQ